MVLPCDTELSCDRYNLLQRGVKESKARVMASTEQFWTVKADEAGRRGGGPDWSTAERPRLYSAAAAQDRPISVASMDRRRPRRRAANQCKLR